MIKLNLPLYSSVLQMFVTQLNKFHTTHAPQKTFLYSQSVNSKKKSNCQFNPTEYTNADEKETNNYATDLGNCVKTSNISRARAIHASLLKTSCFALDALYLHNHLINAYVKCGDTDSGLQLFDEMTKKNVVSWTTLIAGFVQQGFPIEAFSLFAQMHSSGIRPNEFSFVSALQTCSVSENLSLLHTYQIYAMIVKLGFENNVFIVNAFLTALINHDMLEEAVEVFEGCFQRDVVSWNAILGGCLKFSCDNIPELWCRMITEGVVPDEFTYSTVLTGMAELSNLDMGLPLHARLVESGHGSDKCVGNSLVDLYLKNQRLRDGMKAFEEIPVKDVCSWSQMAAGCLNCGETLEVFRVIGEMRRAGVRPNRFTLATGLNACANMASLEEGQKVHTLRIKLGDEADVCVDNALLDMYTKCGDVYGASKVFQSMKELSVVSWTTMIMGYAQNGHAKEAIEIFENMRRQEGVKPNHITLICALYACSQGGFIDKGMEYLSCMRKEYGIAPGEDHFACMVNLLSRAGLIKEAEELIQQMPFEPGAVVWQTLLGACRLHGNMDTAKRAAGHAIALDESDPSTYVLLSNTFAGFGNWNGSEILGQVRKTRDVKKKPGLSWVG